MSEPTIDELIVHWQGMYGFYSNQGRDIGNVQSVNCLATIAALERLKAIESKGQTPRFNPHYRVVDIRDVTYNDPYKRENIVAISYEDMMP